MDECDRLTQLQFREDFSLVLAIGKLNSLLELAADEQLLDVLLKLFNCVDRISHIFFYFLFLTPQFMITSTGFWGFGVLGFWV